MLCAVRQETLRGQQTPYRGGEPFERLFGPHAGIHARRQAVDSVTAQQHDRNTWANRLQASRQLTGVLFPRPPIEHDASNRMQDVQQSDCLGCAVGAYDLAAGGLQCGQYGIAVGRMVG